MDLLTITAKAAQRIAEVLKEEPANSYVRISLKGGSCAGMTHEMTVVTDYDKDDDIIVEQGGTQVVLDSITSSYMKGVTLDWVRESLNQEGFKFSGGAITRTCGCGKSYSYDKEKDKK
jgi:iron-sulfur cluster assembly accessory protein